MNVGARGPGTLFRPTRPRRLRTALLALGLVALVVLALTAWLDRTEVQRIELGHPGTVRIENRAGPVEVIAGTGPVVVEATASYLATSPTLVRTDPVEGNEEAGLLASCPGWGPCRVALVVSVPADATVEVVAAGHPVSVGAVTGDVAVTTDDGPVFLGPSAGTVRVRTATGPVRATDLRSPVVSVATGSGPVELVMGVVPREVGVASDTGEVGLTLPPARYRFDLRGEPLDRSAVPPAPTERPEPAAPSGVVRVHSGGPVTVALGGSARSDRS